MSYNFHHIYYPKCRDNCIGSVHFRDMSCPPYNVSVTYKSYTHYFFPSVVYYLCGPPLPYQSDQGSRPLRADPCGCGSRGTEHTVLPPDIGVFVTSSSGPEPRIWTETVGKRHFIGKSRKSE